MSEYDYNDSQNNGQYPPQPVYGYAPVPTYVYGAYSPYDPRHAAETAEKKTIKRYAMYAALAMLGFLLVQSLLLIILTVFDLYDAYTNEYFFGSGLDILYSVAAVVLPFFAAYWLANRKETSSVFACCGKAKNPSYAVLFILFGFGACLLANEITVRLATLFENVTGVTLPYEESIPPMTATGIAVFFLKIAVVPALCEELAIRGCLLQPLRRYGDLFAILVSAAAFSALHGNVIQIPFAFMAGIALGYVYCKTNSIWASVAVHFLNNAFSCLGTILYEKFDEGEAYRLLTITIAVIGILAIVSGLLLLIKKKAELNKTDTALTTNKKVRAFLFQPLFLCVVLIFIISAVIQVFLKNPS